MTISYNWLTEYLPEKIEPARLADILTSIGLEVESALDTVELKNRLKGLVIGEVLHCEKHPGADKLSLTTVSTGGPAPLKIVCGAPNVAAGQKVVVAPVGTVLHPANGEPFTISKAKIRGIESEGMLCAEDEIGLGENHDGIMVLPETALPGTDFATYRIPVSDVIFEIGLTPNRMDAMSHLGVARDVCAFLTHHTGKNIKVKTPESGAISVNRDEPCVSISVEDPEGCRRYCGICISNITVKESPDWLKNRLQSIGLKPVNNIVDVTNFILHESGLPLHAFDADKIEGGKVIVKTLPEGTKMVTLDKKERKLSGTDLLICDAKGPMCLAGVFGGLESSVTTSTKNIFLESAWFNPSRIRQTSFRHDLRTEAAARFEKGTDISQTAVVLERAAGLILEVAGGKLTGGIRDLFPSPVDLPVIFLSYDYLKKLSGKEYQPGQVKSILTAVQFSIVGDNSSGIEVKAPFSKPDILHPCDIVEEIMRIDGLDNIEIPAVISLAPSASGENRSALSETRIADFLASAGFHEILTNSITNSGYFDTGSNLVKMMNSLSSELDSLRPGLLESGLQSIGFNLNRKNLNLLFFEFGKSYSRKPDGGFSENRVLGLWATGHYRTSGWNEKERVVDFYYLKAILTAIFKRLGAGEPDFQLQSFPGLARSAACSLNGKPIGHLGAVTESIFRKLDIRYQETWYAEIHWDELMGIPYHKPAFSEISRFPTVERDLALVVDRSITYAQMRETAEKLKINHLKSIHLFDLFESDKLGAGKKSMALRFIFQDQKKTLTDQEIENMMDRLISAFEKSVNAEIRK